jgi:hypothetical protein
MEHHIIKTMNQFKDNIIKAGMLAVKETLYTTYDFEIESINFNIDYREESDTYDVYDCKIAFNYGNPSGKPWYRGNNISINNIPEYKLDDINYLYGIFYGYFSALEQVER